MRVTEHRSLLLCVVIIKHRMWRNLCFGRVVYVQYIRLRFAVIENEALAQRERCPHRVIMPHFIRAGSSVQYVLFTRNNI